MKNSNKKQRFFLLEPVLKILAHCSLTCLFHLAKALSFFIARTENQVSNNTKKNISLCFSHRSQAEQKTIYHQSIQHTTCSLIEMAAIWHYPVNSVLKLVSKEDVAEEYKIDSDSKIMVVPHFGSWELMIYWLAQFGEFYTLYKPAQSTQLDEYILSKRTRNGAVLVPTNMVGLRSLLKGLKAGATVMVLPDQKPGRDNAKIDSKFYDHNASTSLLIKRLTKKVDCPVYIGSALRDLSKASYQVVIKKLDETAFRQDDQESADYLNQSIERFVAEDESQYQWSYRRYSEKTYELN